MPAVEEEPNRPGHFSIIAPLHSQRGGSVRLSTARHRGLLSALLEPCRDNSLSPYRLIGRPRRAYRSAAKSGVRLGLIVRVGAVVGRPWRDGSVCGSGKHERWVQPLPHDSGDHRWVFVENHGLNADPAFRTFPPNRRQPAGHWV